MSTEYVNIDIIYRKADKLGLKLEKLYTYCANNIKKRSNIEELTYIILEKLEKHWRFKSEVYQHRDKVIYHINEILKYDIKNMIRELWKKLDMLETEHYLKLLETEHYSREEEIEDMIYGILDKNFKRIFETLKKYNLLTSYNEEEEDRDLKSMFLNTLHRNGQIIDIIRAKIDLMIKSFLKEQNLTELLLQ